MKLEPVLTAARFHLGGSLESSARVCLEDAVRLKDSGDYEMAANRALKSLAYSVGIFSHHYTKAWRHIYGDKPVFLP